MAKRRRQVISGIILALVFCAVVFGAFVVAEYVLLSRELQSLIASFGYIGITVVATIAGLNVIVPIPAASLTPVFVAAGLYFPFIVLALATGTLIADFLGHLFGKLSRDTIAQKYPKVIQTLTKIHHEHRAWLLPIVFLYAAFMPIPNEALIIPLALMGVKWRYLIIPLFFGNLINQIIYAYSFQNAFQLFL